MEVKLFLAVLNNFISIGLLVVLDSFMKNLFTAKSKECVLALVNLQATVQHNNIGKHLHLNNSITTSSDASLPTFLNYM